MRVMRALEIRAKFGEVVDQAAAGERIIVERAGQPVAAIVPLSDLAALEPEAIRERQKAAFDQLMRTARRTRHLGVPISADFLRADRDRGHST